MVPCDLLLFSLLLVLVVYAAKRVAVVRSALRDIPPNVPWEVTLFAPVSLLGLLAPKLNLPYYFPLAFFWHKRGELYSDKPIKIFASVPVFWGDSVLHVADINAAREITAHKSYEKADQDILAVLGNNIISSEGDVWKRHRRIVGPAFNRSTYENVWNATVRVYKDMVFHEGWCDLGAGMPTPVIDINAITHKVALYLICNIAFGLPMNWTDPYRKTDGSSRNGKGQLTIPSLILITSSSAIERCYLPRWLTRLPLPCSIWRRLNEIDEAWDAFEKLMYERVREREKEIKEVRALQAINTEDEERYVADTIKDLFGRLVNSGFSDGKNALTDREIIGNCYVFALAGHETTANTLAATLAFLALNPEKQDWVYRHIRDVLGDREPIFEDYDALDAVLACFHEALRLMPAAYMLFRRALNDHVLQVPQRMSGTSRPSGPAKEQLREDVRMKKGMVVSVDLIGLCYDPQIFHDEPFAYKPERWLKNNMSSESSLAFSEEGRTSVDSGPAIDTSYTSRNLLEDFVEFSFGPRACLGSKFARVEAVSFITHVLRDWRVEIAFLSDSDTGIRTTEEWIEKYMKPRLGVTAALQRVPLRFVRRK